MMMRLSKALAVVFFLVFAVTVLAKPKTRTFKENCGKVFPAAEKMASHKPYRIVLDGKKDMILEVQTGSFWKAGAANIQVRFTPVKDGTCTVTDNSPYSGFRRNGTVFLNRLEKGLKDSDDKSSK